MPCWVAAAKPVARWMENRAAVLVAEPLLGLTGRPEISVTAALLALRLTGLPWGERHKGA